MNGTWLRRGITCGLALFCWAQLPTRAVTVVESDEQRAARVDSEARLKRIEPTCPPQDGHAWYYDPKAAHADRIEWIEIDDPRAFANTCGQPTKYPNLVIDGCAVVYEDPLFGGYYGVIYAMAPWYAMSERWQEHEMCHTLGWRHERL